eukprot:jgi/Bigna1/75994/fgenesh1_pg.38_\
MERLRPYRNRGRIGIGLSVGFRVLVVMAVVSLLCASQSTHGGKLGVKPWWRRFPWDWQDPHLEPAWKRGLLLPQFGNPGMDSYPFWSLTLRILSLPVNAVFYPTRTVLDIPKAIYKRYVLLKPGAVVRVGDWDLEKDHGYFGDQKGSLIKKNVLLGKYEIQLKTGRIKTYNCNDLFYIKKDQYDKEFDSIGHFKNCSVLYSYKNDTKYYDFDATISDDDGEEFHQAVNLRPTLLFGNRTYFMPGDRVRITKGYRAGEYATILKWLARKQKWGVTAMIGDEMLAYSASQLEFFDPYTPLENLISQSDPRIQDTKRLIETFRKDPDGWMRGLQGTCKQLADDPNEAIKLRKEAEALSGFDVERTCHNPVLQHLICLQALYYGDEVNEVALDMWRPLGEQRHAAAVRFETKMSVDPILSPKVFKMLYNNAVNYGGGRTVDPRESSSLPCSSVAAAKQEASALHRQPFVLTDVKMTDMKPAEKWDREDLIQDFAAELLPQFGIHDWKSGPNRTFTKKLGRYRKTNVTREKTYYRKPTPIWEEGLLKLNETRGNLELEPPTHPKDLEWLSYVNESDIIFNEARERAKAPGLKTLVAGLFSRQKKRKDQKNEAEDDDNHVDQVGPKRLHLSLLGSPGSHIS